MSPENSNGAFTEDFVGAVASASDGFEGHVGECCVVPVEQKEDDDLL